MTARYYRYECPNGHRWNPSLLGRHWLGGSTCPSCGYHPEEGRGPIIDHGYHPADGDHYGGRTMSAEEVILTPDPFAGEFRLTGTESGWVAMTETEYGVELTVEIETGGVCADDGLPNVVTFDVTARDLPNAVEELRHRIAVNHQQSRELEALMDEAAAAYDEPPVSDPEAIPEWEALQAQQLREEIDALYEEYLDDHTDLDVALMSRSEFEDWHIDQLVAQAEWRAEEGL